MSQTVTTPLEGKAVVGQRVEFAYFRDLDTYLPGIITEITDDVASLRIRLDGARSTLASRPDYEGLRYLDHVVPVPELPMGPFRPVAADIGDSYHGVAVCQCESDDIVLLTDDRAQADAALRKFCADLGIDYGWLPPLQGRWVVFEWNPEDADCVWTFRFAAEGDDMAVRVFWVVG